MGGGGGDNRPYPLGYGRGGGTIDLIHWAMGGGGGTIDLMGGGIKIYASSK